MLLCLTLTLDKQNIGINLSQERVDMKTVEWARRWWRGTLNSYPMVLMFMGAGGANCIVSMYQYSGQPDARALCGPRWSWPAAAPHTVSRASAPTSSSPSDRTIRVSSDKCFLWWHDDRSDKCFLWWHDLPGWCCVHGWGWQHPTLCQDGVDAGCRAIALAPTQGIDVWLNKHSNFLLKQEKQSMVHRLTDTDQWILILPHQENPGRRWGDDQRLRPWH